MKILTSVTRNKNRAGTTETNRGESCVGVVRVGMDAAGAIRLRRVLGLVRRLASIDVPDARLVLVGVGKVGPGDAPPTIDDSCDDESDEKYP
jgi:hypothetical protein